ncbi:MAG: SMC interacting uncharacterized protein involved in chromosome segregation [Pseudohongiellaceae bacterium]|jgi:SMC interacting uncharacterized protein involved in chromosome segregation
MASNDDLDPMRMMREWFVKSEQMYSDAMTEVMGDERFSKTTGRYMQEALHMQRMFGEAMGQYLANLNLPSRTDIIDVKERISNVEATLDAILVEMRSMRNSSTSASTEKKKPARTKTTAVKDA